jgi:hypothetical protein
MENIEIKYQHNMTPLGLSNISFKASPVSFNKNALMSTLGTGKRTEGYNTLY